MKLFFDIALHDKQFDIFINKSRFRVVVAGRRFGKCLDGDSRVQMADGTVKKIADVKAGDVVTSLNEDTYVLEPKKVQHMMSNGVKETITIRTSARKIRCTPNHPLLANNEWRDASDIKPGDLIGVAKTNSFGSKSQPREKIMFMAAWLAEGSKYVVTNQSPEVIEILRECAKYYGLSVVSDDGLNWRFTDQRGPGRWKDSKNAVREMLEKEGLWGKTSKTKFIPDWVYELPKTDLALFLNVMFATDGTICKRGKSHAIEIGLANEEMVFQIAELLSKFGIRGSVYKKAHKAKSSVSGENFVSWTFTTSDSKHVLAFVDQIGAIGKEAAVENARHTALSSRGNCNTYLPIKYESFIDHLKYQPKETTKFGGYNCCLSRDLPDELRLSLNSWRKQRTDRVSRYRYEQIRGSSDGFFDPIADGDVAWEEVISVEASERVETFDLTIEGNHNFVANGIITHNTILSKAEVLSFAGENPGSNVWYVAPTYRMAKQIMWRELIRSIPRAWIRASNSTTLDIELINGSVIGLRGADKPDSLRGVEVNFLVMDEMQDIKPEAWEAALRPTLAKTRGRVLFVGTPKAYNYLYKLYMLGQKEELKKYRVWESWQLPTITSPFIPLSEIESAKADMDPRTFRQEFLASFESISGRVYYNFDRKTHVGDYPFNPDLPIWVGQDFNVNPMTSVIMQKQPNGEVWVVDEIYQQNSNTSNVCSELERRYYRHTKTTVIYPDPAGGSRSTARGESDLDIFRERGFKRLKFRRQHPLVADRVNAVNKVLLGADGKIRLKIDKKCTHLIDSFEQTIFKEGSNDIDKRLNVEHITDALGYPIEIEFPRHKIEMIGISI